jgi:hypothetical protein
MIGHQHFKKLCNAAGISRLKKFLERNGSGQSPHGAGIHFLKYTLSVIPIKTV